MFEHLVMTRNKWTFFSLIIETSPIASRYWSCNSHCFCFCFFFFFLITHILPENWPDHKSQDFLIYFCIFFFFCFIGLRRGQFNIASIASMKEEKKKCVVIVIIAISLAVFVFVTALVLHKLNKLETALGNFSRSTQNRLHVNWICFCFLNTFVQGMLCFLFFLLIFILLT